MGRRVSRGHEIESPKSSTVTLVLLSFNEKESLTRLIGEIRLSLFDSVFAIDGGSTDGTLDVYASNGIKAYVQGLRGRGRAFQEALGHVDTDLVIFFSTDGNENPADLLRMIECLREGADMVVAGRYLLPGASTDDSDDRLRLRKMAGIRGSWAVNALWGSSIKDAINGFRGFKASTLRKMKLTATNHDIELQTTIRGAKLGIRMKEFATREQIRYAGEHRPSAGTFRLILSLTKRLVVEIFYP